MTGTISYQPAVDIIYRWRIDTGVYEQWQGGQLVETHPFNPDDVLFVGLVQAADATGSGDLLARVRQALTVDKVYLDKVQAGTATAADHAAQAAALTRQVAALIVYVVLQGTEA